MPTCWVSNFIIFHEDLHKSMQFANHFKYLVPKSQTFSLSCVAFFDNKLENSIPQSRAKYIKKVAPEWGFFIKLNYCKSHFMEIFYIWCHLNYENVHSCLTVMFHKSLDPVLRQTINIGASPYYTFFEFFCEMRFHEFFSLFFGF